MRRYLGAWLLTAALILSLLPAMALAADTTLTVKTPENLPKEGEAFTVTVDITGNPGLCAVQFTLAYDKNRMTCTDAEEGGLLDGMARTTNPSAADGAVLLAASTSPATGDGTLGTFTFRAEQDIDEFAFKIANVVLTDANVAAVAYTVVGAEEIEPDPATPAATEPDKPAEQTSRTVQPDAEAKPATQTAAEAAATRFNDTAGHWGASWIEKAADLGLFQGDGTGSFNPNRSISRGDYVLVLYRMAGEPESTETAPFADVHADDYYAKAIAWAYSKGYVNGKGAGFAPRDGLTRQEAMKILFAYAGRPLGMEAMLTGAYDEMFADSGDIAAWAKPAMYWAYYHGIIDGTGVKALGPTVTATRAQLAKILVGYMEKQ